MLRQLSIGAAMISATAALVYAGTARAEPPPSGWLGSFMQSMIVCDSAQSIKDLVAAHRDSDTAFAAKSKELLAGDSPRCQPAHIMNMIVGSSEDLGQVSWGAAKEHLWILEIHDASKQMYVMYEEMAAPIHDTSI